MVPAQRDAANAANAGNYDQVKEFLRTRAYPHKDDDDRVAVQKILNTGGPITRDAANRALSGTPEDVRAFLATGRLRAAEDELRILEDVSEPAVQGGRRNRRKERDREPHTRPKSRSTRGRHVGIPFPVAGPRA